MNELKKRTFTSDNAKKFSTKLIKLDDKYRYSEEQHNPKTYRLIMQKFLSEINSFGRKNRDCLGQIDEYYKIMLTKEEKIYQEENLIFIFDKNIEKLKREMMHRNLDIHRTRNLYQQDYEKIFSVRLLENPSFQEEETQPCKKYITEIPSDQEQKNDKKTTPDNLRSKSNKMQRVINQIGKGKETKGIKNAITQSTNMDDPQFHETQAYECLILKRQKRKRHEFLGKQVFIHKNNCKKTSTITYNSTTVNKFFNRNYTNAKQLLKKSVDELEREKLQNKLIMINSNHSINCVQPQGYKPKIKCWKPCFQSQNRYLL